MKKYKEGDVLDLGDEVKVLDKIDALLVNLYLADKGKVKLEEVFN